MLRRSAGRSSGWSIPCARRRGRGEARRLQPPAAASRCRLRNRLRPEAAKRRRARRLQPWAEPSLPQADLRPRSCLRQGSVLLTLARISVSRIIWLVSIYIYMFFLPEACCRVGRGTIGCCPTFGGSHLAIGGGKGEGGHAGPVGRLLRERRDSDGRCR
jgi:hypothetical protein